MVRSSHCHITASEKLIQILQVKFVPYTHNSVIKKHNIWETVQNETDDKYLSDYCQNLQMTLFWEYIDVTRSFTLTHLTA